MATLDTSARCAVVAYSPSFQRRQNSAPEIPSRRRASRSRIASPSARVISRGPCTGTAPEEGRTLLKSRAPRVRREVYFCGSITETTSTAARLSLRWNFPPSFAHDLLGDGNCLLVAAAGHGIRTLHGPKAGHRSASLNEADHSPSRIALSQRASPSTGFSFGGSGLLCRPFSTHSARRRCHTAAGDSPSSSRSTMRQPNLTRANGDMPNLSSSWRASADNVRDQPPDSARFRTSANRANAGTSPSGSHIVAIGLAHITAHQSRVALLSVFAPGKTGTGPSRPAAGNSTTPTAGRGPGFAATGSPRDPPVSMH